MVYDPARQSLPRTPMRGRRSIRLRHHDYASPGAYFVTVCVQHRACLLGDVLGETVRLSEAGRIVQAAWDDLPEHYPHVALDAFVVMPNHIHGILCILDGGNATDGDGPDRRGLINQTPTWILMNTRGDSLGKIVRRFKAQATRHIRLGGSPAFAWQRTYWERVLRDQRELDCARRYIRDNPLPRTATGCTPSAEPVRPTPSRPTRSECVGDTEGDRREAPDRLEVRRYEPEEVEGKPVAEEADAGEDEQAAVALAEPQERLAEQLDAVA